MPINTQELCEAISILAEKENLRINLKQSSKGAVICAATCFIGGVVLGPVGLAIGGTAGGITAALLAKGSFKSVAAVIRNDLTVQEREMLKDKIITTVSEIETTDLAVLLPLIMNNPSIKDSVLNTVVSFIQNEMQLQILNT